MGAPLPALAQRPALDLGPLHSKIMMATQTEKERSAPGAYTVQPKVRPREEHIRHWGVDVEVC